MLSTAEDIDIKMKKAIFFLLCLTVSLLLFKALLVRGHSHGHSHEEHDHGHGHSHGDHDHDHGHGHGEHLHPDDYAHEDHRHLYYRPQENAEEEHEHEEHEHEEHEHEEHEHKEHEHHEHHAHDAGSAKKQEAETKHDHHHHSKPALKRFDLSTWINAIGATLLISAAPFLLLFLIPLEKNTEAQKPLLKVLLSFASGGLLGDAFLHLIPHAVSPHSHGGGEDDGHSHGHDHDRGMIVGLWVLAGIITFLIVEKVVRYVKGGHSHSHSHGVPVPDHKDIDKKDSAKSQDSNAKEEEENEKEDQPDVKNNKGASLLPLCLCKCLKRSLNIRLF